MATKADWYVQVRDEARGPFTAEQMRTAAQKGLVVAETKVRKGVDGQWFRAEQVQGLIPAAEPPMPDPAATPPAAAPPPPPPVTAAPLSHGGEAEDRPAARIGDQPALVDIPEIPLIPVVEPDVPLVRRYRRRRSNPKAVLAIAGAGVVILLSILFWLAQEPAAVKTPPPPDEVPAADPTGVDPASQPDTVAP